MFGILLLLGPFRFSLSSAAYDELTRTSEYNWAEIDKATGPPDMQFTGEKAEKITLRGRIIPGFTGGVEQVARMRALAGLGTPLFLVDGMGRVHGNWVIESVTDTGTRHFRDGYPRMVTFDVALKKYNGGQGVFGMLGKASNFLSLFR